VFSFCNKAIPDPEVEVGVSEAFVAAGLERGDADSDGDVAAEADSDVTAGVAEAFVAAGVEVSGVVGWGVEASGVVGWGVEVSGVVGWGMEDSGVVGATVAASLYINRVFSYPSKANLFLICSANCSFCAAVKSDLALYNLYANSNGATSSAHGTTGLGDNGHVCHNGSVKSGPNASPYKMEVQHPMPAFSNSVRTVWMSVWHGVGGASHVTPARQLAG
jgi:hypothetical protein